MQTEAVEHAREDMSAHHLIDVRTTLEFDLNKAERLLKRYGHLSPVEERSAIERAIVELRRLARECSDPRLLNEQRELFNHSILPLAERAMAEALREEVATG